MHLPKSNLIKLRSLFALPKAVLIIFTFCLLIMISLGIYILFQNQKVNSFVNKSRVLSEKLEKTQKSLTALQSEDQIAKNKKLEDEINSIHSEYKKALNSYEGILDLKIKTDNTSEIDKLFAQSLDYLSQRNYASASSTIASLNKLIDKQTAQIATSPVSEQPQNVTPNNTPPGSGFSRQAVNTGNGSFTVDIVAADLSSTRVIVDTASDSDCNNDCPVLPLASYIARNGAFAGINGSYFCPSSYPSCAGKTNSFDLLVMNKNKYYFNSGNNVYSTNPAVIFQSGSIRFVGQALQWGRDTSPDGVLSNYPLLLSGGNVVGSGGAKGAKDFVGNKGNTVYIGVVKNATFAEAAEVLKAMGLDNAMNLDEGGSTALWAGGYKDGPGRDIPNAILFIRK